MSPKGRHHLQTHSHNNRLRLPTATKDMKTLVKPAQMQGGLLPSSLARFYCDGTTCSALAVHMQCTNLAMVQQPRGPLLKAVSPLPNMSRGPYLILIGFFPLHCLVL